MAEIKWLTFSITRTSHPVGHICRVDYSYELYIDPDQYEHQDTFTVSAELYGDDLSMDQPLGEEYYDAHLVRMDTAMPVKRDFIVPCDVLDEKLGKDKIFLQLVVKSSAGEVFTAKSDTIKDRF